MRKALREAMLRSLLRDRVQFVGEGYLHLRAWWRDAEILAALGPALAGLFEERPTVVAGSQSSGYMLGPLVAVHLKVGFAAVRKAEPGQVSALDSAPLRDGSVLALDRGAVGPGDRVLFVDDLVESGEQARAVRALVERAGASWIGAAVVVDMGEEEFADVRALISYDALR
ncbi:phosphoribosyltransferase family protein [Longispora albida]|uniref:phosphoribosyltransferase family protein n=1 Tax=Longispora albida TaxID=203523 RepID=UPI00036A03BD|nr:phosphoribosyltransferase family protein [Longispora albida]